MDPHVDPPLPTEHLPATASPPPPAWWTGLITLLALAGAAGVGYFIGWTFGPAFPTHEYQLRRLAVGERFIHLRNTPPPAGVEDEAWQQMTGAVISAYAYATGGYSRTDIETLDHLGQQRAGLDWESQPPNTSDLRRVLQDMVEVVGTEDEYFAGIVAEFEAAAVTSSGE